MGRPLQPSSPSSPGARGTENLRLEAACVARRQKHAPVSLAEGRALHPNASPGNAGMAALRVCLWFHESILPLLYTTQMYFLFLLTVNWLQSICHKPVH